MQISLVVLIKEISRHFDGLDGDGHLTSARFCGPEEARGVCTDILGQEFACKSGVEEPLGNTTVQR